MTRAKIRRSAGDTLLATATMLLSMAGAMLLSMAAALLLLATPAGAQSPTLPPGDGVGVQNPATGHWFLRDTAGNITGFLYGNPADIPFMGDWNCDGVDTPGLFRPVDSPEGPAGKFYLRNSNTTGIADIEFFYGNPDDVPVVGDWDGDGCDTPGIYRPSTQEFHLKNSLGANNQGIGRADITFTFGSPGDVPFVGDWDGDGVTGVGTRNPVTTRVLQKDVPVAGSPDTEFFYGNPGDEPLAGDWDGNPTETVGVYRPFEATFYLKNTNATSIANLTVALGDPFWNPFSWSPTPDNGPPTATPQQVSTNEDTPVTITLTGTDPDDDPLGFSIVGGPSNGALSGTPPVVTYAPRANFHGTDRFTFTATDDDGETSPPATVQITVTPVNDPPVGNPDAYATGNDQALVVNGLLDNDTDVDGDGLEVAAVQGAATNVGSPTATTAGATVTVAADGSFTYDPATSPSLQSLAAGASVDDTFTYRLSDGVASVGPVTVTVTVTGVPATVVVEKVTDPPGGFGGVFSFTGDVAGTINGEGSLSVTGLDPGTYTSTEDEPGPQGFVLTDVSCDDTDSTGDAGTRTATFVAAPGETVTCTFTNTRLGLIQIFKNADPDDPQSFSFTSPSFPPFTVTNDGSSSNLHQIFSVPPGTHTITEGALPDWDLIAITCSDGNSAGDVPSRTATIVVDPNETVSCTFRNQKRGTITITKDAVPDDPQDFGFTGDLGAFSLDDDGDPTLENTTTFANVEAGLHNVTEALPAGWDLTDITCVEDKGQGSGSSGSTAVISLDPGEIITCTFTNTKRGSITVVKDAVPDDPQDFDFTSDVPGHTSFSLDDDADATLANTRLMADVVPGTYSVAETVPAGWDLTSATCDDGSPVTAIDLAPAEDVTCTFVNVKGASITIVKDAVPDDPQDFTFSGSFGSFTLDDDSDPALSNSAVFANLTPGTYNVAETVPAGWDLTSATCSDGSPVSAIDLAPGEAVTCTFTNTKRGSITIVKDSVPDNPADFDYSQNIDGSGNFQLDDDADGTLPNTKVFPDIEPGTYTVTESPITNLTGFNCTDGNSSGVVATGVLTVMLDPGESVSCTFVNSFNTPPTIDQPNPPTVNAPENQTSVTDVESSDPDGDTEFAGLTYSLTDDDGAGPNGSDNALFSINVNSGVLTFNSAPDFENPGDANTDNDYEVQVTVTDSVGATDSLDITVTVTDANDAPTLDLDPLDSSGARPDFTGTFTEGGGAENLTDPAVDVGDEDGDNIVSATITLTNPLDGGAEELDHASGTCTGIALAGTGSHTVTLTGTTTPANYEACLADLTYENTSDDPTAAPDRIVTIVVNDGTANSPTRTTTITVVPVNDPPTLTGPGAFDSLGNVGIDVPQVSGLVGAATINDPDWAGPFTVSTFDATSANGGTVAVNPDGSFTYDPAPGFEGADTFTYTVCDGGSPLPSECSSAATVTVNVADVIWFVDGDNGSDVTGDGTLANPYASLTPLNNDGTDLDDPSDVIFVYDSTADYDVNDAGGFILENAQQLIGEGAVGAGGDTVADEALFTTPTHSKTLPAINGAAPTIGNGLGDVLTLANGNTITGVDLDPTSSGAIVGNTISGLTVADVSVDTSGGTNNNDGIDLTAPDGIITFTDVTIASSSTNSGTAVDIDLAAATADIDFLGSSSVTQTEGSLVDVTNSASGADITFGAGTTVVSTDPTSTAFNLVDNGGATITFGGGLSAVQTAGNTAAGLVISNAAGTSTVSLGGATSVVDVFGAPAIDASDATLTATFGRVASLASPGVGVRLNDIAGSVTVGNIPPGSSIVNATGTAFEVDGGTATIFFDGTIDNGSGFDVDVKNRPAGAGDVTFANDIGFAAPTTGLGISATNNAGGQIAFNGLTRLNTGASNAVALTGNGGATVRFFGGLDIDTTSGIGFQATGGGTIEVLSGGTTTVDVGAGAPHAVDLNGVAIGPGDVTWDSITAAGGCALECVDIDATTNAGTFFGGTVAIASTAAGAGVSIDSSSAAFDFASATIDNTAAAGIDLNGANGSVTFHTVDIDGTGGAGVEISGNTNPVLIDAGSIGATTPSTGDGVNINGGGSTVTIDATIDQTGAANSVDVRNRAGGTVAFNGAIDDDATGVFLNANGSGSVAFTGGMTLDTGASTAFTATTSGTVSVTGTNTIGATTPLTDTAVNISDTTIGGSGVTFRELNVDAGAAGSDSTAIILDDTGSGTFTVTGDGSTGTKGGNDSGGRIENLTDVDAVTLNNTGGLVTFQNMTIEDVGDTQDATDPNRTIQGRDGIHGQAVNGGLRLLNVTMRDFSDNAVLGGTLVAPPAVPATTSFVGLEIRDSVFEDSNRFSIPPAPPAQGPPADDSNEGMVRILGLSGTVIVEGSDFRRGAELLDFLTATSGTVTFTIQDNDFRDAKMEFCQTTSVSCPNANVGKLGVDITIQGSTNATVHFGDPAEASAALGNTVHDAMTGSLRIMQETTATGTVSVVVSQNTFEVDDHLTGPDGSPGGSFKFNFPQGGVKVESGGGPFEAKVTNNTFTGLSNADGRKGSISLLSDGAGVSEFIVTGNTITNPWTGMADVLADGNNDMRVLFQSNTWNGTATGGSAGDDLGSACCPLPFEPFLVFVSGGGNLDITIKGENLPAHDPSSGFDKSFYAAMTSSGGTLDIFMGDTATAADANSSANGYRFDHFSPGGTINLSRDGSASGTLPLILSDNNNTGGGGSAVTDPPDAVAPTGAPWVAANPVTFVNTYPTLPVIP